MTLREPPDRPHGAEHGSPPATPAGGADEIIEATHRYGVRLPGSALVLVKGLLLVESVALELAPDLKECVEALRRLPDLLPPGPAPGRPTLMEAR